MGIRIQFGIFSLKKVTSAIWTQSELPLRMNCSVMTFLLINKPLAHTVTRESQEVLKKKDLIYLLSSYIFTASCMSILEDISHDGQLNITT